MWRNKGTQAYVVVAANDSVSPCLIVPSLEIDPWAETPSWINDVRPYGTFYRELPGRESSLARDDAEIARLAQSSAKVSAVRTLAGVLTEKGLKDARLAVDETGMPPSLWLALAEGLPHAQISDGSALLRATRMVKTPDEVDRLTQATRVNEEAFGVAVKAMVPGATQRELVCLYMSEVASRGGMAYAASISAGLWSAHVHPNVSDYVLRPGDIVKSDVACTVNLYWADTARTRAVTTVTPDQERTYEALLAGEQAAIRSIRPGIPASDVFQVAVETIRAAGLPDYQRTHCGHGIGVSIYDPPLIQPREATSDIANLGRTETVLEEGMLFCIETPYYAVGKWGMTVEDTVVVEATGARVLTSMDRALSG
jgi:Xaa-Pro aminopeptidase